MRTTVILLAAVVVVLVGYIAYLRVSSPAAGPSVGTGVANSSGGSSSGQSAGNVNNNCPPGTGSGGCGQPAVPTNAAPGCRWLVANCGVNPDWGSGRFDVFFAEGSKPSTSVKDSIYLMMEQVGASMVCTEVKGNIDVEVGGPPDPFKPPSWSATETIPFDTSINSKYPPAVTSGAITPPNSPPPAGLIGTFKAGCSPTVTRMIVHPFDDPENKCGCNTTLIR